MTRKSQGHRDPPDRDLEPEEGGAAAANADLKPGELNRRYPYAKRAWDPNAVEVRSKFRLPGVGVSLTFKGFERSLVLLVAVLGVVGGVVVQLNTKMWALPITIWSLAAVIVGVFLFVIERRR